jgi:hypothetical protein
MGLGLRAGGVKMEFADPGRLVPTALEYFKGGAATFSATAAGSQQRPTIKILVKVLLDPGDIDGISAANQRPVFIYRHVFDCGW